MMYVRNAISSICCFLLPRIGVSADSMMDTKENYTRYASTPII